MAGLVPAIHDFLAFYRKCLESLAYSQHVDGRDKPGHDDVGGAIEAFICRPALRRQKTGRLGSGLWNHFSLMALSSPLFLTK
jgi:hypothetical protein